MNYAAYSWEELASLAETHEGARTYIAANARDLVEDLKDRENDYIQGLIDDAHHDGQDEGSNAERDHFRDEYGEDIRDIYRRLKATEQPTELRQDCCELLGNLIQYFGIEEWSVGGVLGD